MRFRQLVEGLRFNKEMKHSVEIPTWKGCPDQLLARRAVRDELIVTVCFLGIMNVLCAAISLQGIGWMLVFSWWSWVFIFSERIGDAKQYVGAEYIIDEFGVRGFNRKLGRYWGPVAEQADAVQINVKEGYVDVTWERPTKTVKGTVIQPRDGLRFVTNNREMEAALGAWIANVRQRSNS
jgi:hypothetical protein